MSDALLDALPWLLLANTLVVRYLLARHNRLGFVLDILSVPAWVTFYILHEAWPLIAIPFVFAYLDIKALTRWWA